MSNSVCTITNKSQIITARDGQKTATKTGDNEVHLNTDDHPEMFVQDQVKLSQVSGPFL